MAEGESMTDNFKTVSLIILTAIVSGLVVIVGLVLMILASESALAADGGSGSLTPISLIETAQVAIILLLIAFVLSVLAKLAPAIASPKAILASCTVAFAVVLSIVVARAQENWWQRPAIMACCSEAGAVFADEWTIHPDGSVTAVVTGGGPRNHGCAPIGRRYEVPRDKIRDREGNPTGRPLLFINPNNLPHVYCFVPGVMT